MGRVRRAGREWVWVMEVMVVCVSVRVVEEEEVVVVDGEVDEGLEKEKRESERWEREKEEMVVESKERAENADNVKRDPQSKYAVILLVMLVDNEGANVVSYMESEESRER